MGDVTSFSFATCVPPLLEAVKTSSTVEAYQSSGLKPGKLTCGAVSPDVFNQSSCAPRVLEEGKSHNPSAEAVQLSPRYRLQTEDRGANDSMPRAQTVFHTLRSETFWIASDSSEAHNS